VFADCGYNVEVAKCYPSDRFWIFLNEIYIGGRHVVHGTRAAATICSENTELHTTLVERTASVSAGCRGAVAAGLDAPAAAYLQATHVWRHILEWTRNMDPVAAAIWSMAPRGWGGLGLPSMLQLGSSGGGTALAEGMYTMQQYARHNDTARRFYLTCAREPLVSRAAVSVLAAPLGGRLATGILTDSRVPGFVRDALNKLRGTGELSPLAAEFLAYSAFDSLAEFAAAIVPVGNPSIIQKQVLDDAMSTHMHTIFTRFTRRLEKSSTLSQIITRKLVGTIVRANHADVISSVECLMGRLSA